MRLLLLYLFPRRFYDPFFSWMLLFQRLVFGLLLLKHGINKFILYDGWAPFFPDPFGLGARFSLVFTASTECVCSIAFILGLLHRICIIPVLVIMCVAFFIIFQGEPFFNRELPFVYFMVFLSIYITGPGRYSVDHMLLHWIKR